MSHLHHVDQQDFVFDRVDDSVGALAKSVAVRMARQLFAAGGRGSSASLRMRSTIFCRIFFESMRSISLAAEDFSRILYFATAFQ